MGGLKGHEAMATSDPTIQSNGTPANGSPLAKSAAIVHATPSASEGNSIAAFASQSNFESAQRMAKALAASTLVPSAYQGNVPNCLIAMEMASRIGASVFMVMQSLDVIHGRPSWSSKFLIGTVNASRRFTPLRFKYEGATGTMEWGCRAVARDRETGEECVGPLVTIQMAKDEGWLSKNGSKWKTMPELMLMYRSAGFWTRVYCPEIGLGLMTSDEVIDTTGYTVDDVAPVRGVATTPKELEAELLNAPEPKAEASWTAGAVEHVDPNTGEVTGPAPKRTGKAKEAEPTMREPGEDDE